MKSSFSVGRDWSVVLRDSMSLCMCFSLFRTSSRYCFSWSCFWSNLLERQEIAARRLVVFSSLCLDGWEARRWSRKTWKSMMMMMVMSHWMRLSNDGEDVMLIVDVAQDQPKYVMKRVSIVYDGDGSNESDGSDVCVMRKRLQIVKDEDL